MHFVHHQAGSIYKKPPECQSLTSEHKPGWGSERGCYHTMNVSSKDTEGRDPLTSPAKREVCSLPHCHPTERRTIIFMNKARPGVGTAATGFPTASNTVIQGVTRAGRSDRRSRVWPQTSRKMTPGNGKTAWLAGLPVNTHCPRWGERSPRKSVISVIISHSILLLWTLKHYWRRYLNKYFQQMSEVFNYDFTTSSQNQFSPIGMHFLKRNLNGHIKFDMKKFTL